MKEENEQDKQQQRQQHKNKPEHKQAQKRRRRRALPISVSCLLRASSRFFTPTPLRGPIQRPVGPFGTATGERAVPTRGANRSVQPQGLRSNGYLKQRISWQNPGYRTGIASCHSKATGDKNTMAKMRARPQPR